MDNSFSEYIILFFAAFVPAISVLVFKIRFNKNLKLFLSFSGAFLLAISVLHLFPEIYSHYSTKVGVFILIGFLLQVLLEFFSDGVEHGHSHSNSNDLSIFPYTIFISLFIHAFIEGMALFNSETHAHHHHNSSLMLGIIIHKIPVVIVLATMLLSKSISKFSFFIATIVFALASPLGLFMASRKILYFNDNTTIFLALAVGIFLHISTTILFESTEGHKFDLKKFSTIILAFTLAYFTL